MRKALATLLRVRDAKKKQARLSFAEAERMRIQQEDRVVAVHDAIARSHSQDIHGYDGGGAAWLALEHRHRLRLRLDARREEATLTDRAEVVQARREVLVGADRDARVVEMALERYDEAIALEERRKDGRRIDAMATARWWRERMGDGC